MKCEEICDESEPPICTPRPAELPPATQECNELTSSKGPFRKGTFSDGEMGFWTGVIIAVFCGVLLKFAAVAMQQKVEC